MTDMNKYILLVLLTMTQQVHAQEIQQLIAKAYESSQKNYPVVKQRILQTNSRLISKTCERFTASFFSSQASYQSAVTQIPVSFDLH
jgi:hypothetical protein